MTIAQAFLARRHAGPAHHTKRLRGIGLEVFIEHLPRYEVGKRSVWVRFGTSSLLRGIETWVNSVNSDSGSSQLLIAAPFWTPFH
jgi:hypothetical protein